MAEITSKFLFAKFYSPHKQNNGKILTIGIPQENLQKLEVGKQYMIKFYELEVDE